MLKRFDFIKLSSGLYDGEKLLLEQRWIFFIRITREKKVYTEKKSQSSFFFNFQFLTLLDHVKKSVPIFDSFWSAVLSKTYNCAVASIPTRQISGGLFLLFFLNFFWCIKSKRVRSEDVSSKTITDHIKRGVSKVLRIIDNS